MVVVLDWPKASPVGWNLLKNYKIWKGRQVGGRREMRELLACFVVFGEKWVGGIIECNGYYLSVFFIPNF